MMRIDKVMELVWCTTFWDSVYGYHTCDIERFPWIPCGVHMWNQYDICHV